MALESVYLGFKETLFTLLTFRFSDSESTYYNINVLVNSSASHNFFFLVSLKDLSSKAVHKWTSHSVFMFFILHSKIHWDYVEVWCCFLLAENQQHEVWNCGEIFLTDSNKPRWNKRCTFANLFSPLTKFINHIEIKEFLYCFGVIETLYRSLSERGRKY